MPKTKIYYCSDLHFEFGILEKIPVGTICVIAGDLTVANSPKNIADALRRFSANFLHVVYIAGNHEFYHGDYAEHLDNLRNHGFANVHFLDREAVVIDGVAFIGAILWTDFKKRDPLAMLSFEQQINDYRLIRYDDGKFAAERVASQHAKDAAYVEGAIKKHQSAGNKTVVVTHHAPSMRSVHSKYAGSILNWSFCNDMDAMILETQPDFWVHGHMHESFDYKIGETTVLCNPRGYFPFELNPVFDLDEYFTI